jgi:uncharacterized DUF497 family protein
MGRIDFGGFDWDAGNQQKCRKHGVTIEEIEALFRGEPRIAPSPRRELLEERFLAIGRNRSGRPLFVAFTFRKRAGVRLIRPISARYMHAEEIAAYEAESS